MTLNYARPKGNQGGVAENKLVTVVRHVRVGGLSNAPFQRPPLYALAMKPSRAGTRNKSRSPAPPQTQFLPAPPSRRPAFLPPSHYAAAAGLPHTARSSSKQDDTNSAASRPAVYMPVSYPSESGSEEFTVESPLAAKLRPSLLGRKSSLTSISSKKPVRRKSQMGLIEDLESQLLPSLSDTIGRMTQSPQYQNPPSDISAEPPMSPRIPLSTSATSAHKISTSRQGGVLPPAPVTDASTTPRSHSKPALKSALRTLNSPAALTSVEDQTPKAVRRVKSTIGGSGIPRKVGSGSELEGSHTARTSTAPKV